MAILGSDVLGATQTPTPNDPSHNRPRRRWEISWTAGGSSGGAAVAITGAMSAAGLNSTIPGGCFFLGCWGDIHHPWSDDGGTTRMLAVSYAVRPWWTLRLQHTVGDLSETLGYRAPSGWLSLRQSVTSVSVLAVVSAGGLHAGVGPSLHRLAVTREEYHPSNSRRSRVGMTFHSGLSLPARTRVFADVAVQYQLVGSMNVGPLTTSDSTATMARTRASFSYRTVKVGFGVRL